MENINNNNISDNSFVSGSNIKGSVRDSFEDSSVLLRRKNLTELIIWNLIGFVLIIGIILIAEGQFHNPNLTKSIIFSFYEFGLYWGIAILLFLFPQLYKLVFDNFPFTNLSEYYKELRAQNKRLTLLKEFKEKGVVLYGQTGSIDNAEENLNEKTEEPSIENAKESLIEKTEEFSIGKTNNSQDFSSHGNSSYGYSMELIYESSKLANNVYSSSKVYLLIGSLIAIFGVIIFYIPLIYIDTPKNIGNIYEELIKYLPRIGALFFVEYIAFFFLKQYRIMMEEFRYYEAIKRKRQDNVVLFELVDKYGDRPDILKLIIDTVFQSHNKKLSSDESTEILETQKIVNQDFDIFSKFTDLVNAIKSK